MRNVVVLGSTGSIGRQTLDVAGQFPDRVRIVGLSAHHNLSGLQEQVRQFKPRYVAVGNAETARSADPPVRGPEAIVEMAAADEVDLVVVGTVGAAGLLPTLAALDAGKLVALANKETLVMAGPIIRDRLRAGARLVPIDSEHSAIWQCLQGEPERSTEKLVLTASGGALRHLAIEELAGVTPEQALRHPTWRMGPKITVDCANLMNKGLEVLEATWLFNVPVEQVDIVIHPESVVHSMVYFDDSSVKAQLGLPDMRLPIQYALSHPDRWGNELPRLDLAALGSLHFDPVDWNRYPCLKLALDAGRLGGTYPAALCAADEIAVERFLSGSIGFTDIPRLIAAALDAHRPCSRPSLDDILQADRTAREACQVLASQIR